MSSMLVINARTMTTIQSMIEMHSYLISNLEKAGFLSMYSRLFTSGRYSQIG